MGHSPLVSSFPHLQLPAVVGRGLEECELEGEHLFVAAVTLCGQEKKRRRKSCHSIYEREELATYIPIAKPFLRHPSAAGGVQLPCLLARCPPARCRSGEVRPVKCCFGMVPVGILPS